MASSAAMVGVGYMTVQGIPNFCYFDREFVHGICVYGLYEYARYMCKNKVFTSYCIVLKFHFVVL